MKITEAVIGFFILAILLIGGASILVFGQNKFDQYMDKLSQDAKIMSLYNYSDYFISQINTSMTGYIYMSGNNYFIGSTGDYYFECNKTTSSKFIMSQEAFTGVFCKITYGNQVLNKYKIIK